MAVQHRKQLSRLNIPSPLNASNTSTFNGQPIYSPSIPSAIQQGLHQPIFPGPHTLQAPLQSPFLPSLPPGSLSRVRHQPNASLAQLPVSLLPPSSAGPASNGFSSYLGPSSPGIALHLKSRRTASISIGGPPKAPLGGPQRKPSPLVPAADGESTNLNSSIENAATRKKVAINLPEERGPVIYEGKAYQSPPWARKPIQTTALLDTYTFDGLEIYSAEEHPSLEFRYSKPLTFDVFLPSEDAWNAYRRAIVDERLALLGLSDASGPPTEFELSNPILQHDYSDSISSPADPALLAFKLNKLQRSQGNSTSTSPLPSAHSPLTASSVPPRFQHLSQGYSDEPSLPSPPIYNNHDSQGHLHAPKAWAPMNQNDFISGTSDSAGSSRPLSRRDFVRGFGLDIPEEESDGEGVDAFGLTENIILEVPGDDASVEDNGDTDDGDTGSATAAPSRFHSRHVSRASELVVPDGKENERESQSPLDSGVPRRENTVSHDDASEWTASDDPPLNHNHTDGDESLDEFSNPSDEERAHQRRIHDRMAHLSLGTEEIPRRLPNFPLPPDTPGVADPTYTRSFDAEIVSNPSDEENPLVKVANEESGQRPVRPLPPLPHSRTPSNSMFMASIPSKAHSRAPSGASMIPSSGFQTGHSFSLNQRNGLVSPTLPGTSHTRASSTGKTLNAFAQEFKPTGFTFQPPPGVPTLAFPPPEASKVWKFVQTPFLGRAEQGREKRQRRLSRESGEAADINQPMPQMSSVVSTQGSQPINLGSLASVTDSSVTKSWLNAAAKPFTPSGLTGSSVALAHSSSSSHMPLNPYYSISDGTANEATQAEITAATDIKSETLDLQQQFSNNTVPAALFQSLIQGDENVHRSPKVNHAEVHEMYRTRSRQQSLDDIHVPSISRKASRVHIRNNSLDRGSILAGTSQLTENLIPELEVAAQSRTEKSIILSQDEHRAGHRKSPTHYLDQYEHRLEDLLDDRIDLLRRDVIEALPTTRTTLDDPALEKIAALLIRRFDHHSGSSISPDSVHEAPSYQFAGNIVEKIVEQVRYHLDQHLTHIQQVTDSARVLEDAVEEKMNRGIVPVTLAAAELASRMDALENTIRSRGNEDREILVHDVLAILTPRLDDLRAEPLDFDHLTAKLSTAVRPHIHELIDLASDKKETAELIVRYLTPLLQDIANNQSIVNIDGVISQLVTRLSPSWDSISLTEGISDLIVERLDSRLQVRDRVLNAELLSKQIMEHLNMDLGPMIEFSKLFASVATDNDIRAADLVSSLYTQSSDLTKTLLAVESLSPHIDRLNTSVLEQNKGSREAESHALHALESLKSSVEVVIQNHAKLAVEMQELSSFQQGGFHPISTLPSEFSNLKEMISQLHQAVASMSHTSVAESALDTLSASNAMLQTKLEEANLQIQRVTVERDVESKRANAAKRDYIVLHERADELETRAHEVKQATARNQDLEDALMKAQDRLSVLEQLRQENEGRIQTLEISNRELDLEKSRSKAKVDALEMQMGWLSQDKMNVQRELKQIQGDRDRLISQQTQWDEVRRTAEQVEILAELVRTLTSKESEDLQSIRDRSKVLEGEHSALQKRFREQESKLSNVERASMTARQNLAQAQQRASDWEKRAKEFESLLERSQSRTLQIEETKDQLETELAVLRSDLETKEVANKVQIDQMQNEIEALSRDLSRVNSELDVARKAPVHAWRNRVPNGMIAPSSTHDTPRSPQTRGSTPTPGLPDPQTTGSIAYPSIDKRHETISSTWNSMHAPKSAWGSKLRSLPPRHLAGSPTPSVVSNAPTLQEDGWWS